MGTVENCDRDSWNNLRHFAADHINNKYMRNLLADNGMANCFLFNY